MSSSPFVTESPVPVEKGGGIKRLEFFSFSAVSLAPWASLFSYLGLFIYKWVDGEESTAQLPPSEVIRRRPAL